MNTEWHKANVLGQKASIGERITWHLKHQKECACRPIPKSVQDVIKNQN